MEENSTINTLQCCHLPWYNAIATNGNFTYILYSINNYQNAGAVMSKNNFSNFSKNVPSATGIMRYCNEKITINYFTINSKLQQYLTMKGA